jgi:hypothetical protein
LRDRFGHEVLGEVSSLLKGGQALQRPMQDGVNLSKWAIGRVKGEEKEEEGKE